MTSQVEEMAARGWIPVLAASSLVGVHHTTLYRSIKTKMLTSTREGSRLYIQRKSLALLYPSFGEKILAWSPPC